VQVDPEINFRLIQFDHHDHKVANLLYREWCLMFNVGECR